MAKPRRFSPREHLREARERVAELERQRVALLAEADALDAARAPAAKRLAAIDAKRGKVPALVEGGSYEGIRVGTMAHVHAAGYGYRELLAGKRPKEVVEALESGAVKVSGSQMDRTVKGQVQKLRIPTPGDLRAWRRTHDAVARAERALERAKHAEREAVRTAFANGRKLTAAELAADVARRTIAELAVAALPTGARKRDEAERIASESWGPLADARTHLGHAQAVAKGTAEPGACPCRECAGRRDQAKREAEEAERIAALPTALFDCPSCGRRHRGPHDEVRQYVRDDDDVAKAIRERVPTFALSSYGQWFMVPRIRCATADKWFIFTAPLVAKSAAEAKAAAKAKRAARVAGVAGKAWVCPNPECGEVNDLAAGESQVCESCEVEWATEALRVDRRAKLEAALGIAQEREEAA